MLLLIKSIWVAGMAFTAALIFIGVVVFDGTFVWTDLLAIFIWPYFALFIVFSTFATFYLKKA